MTEDEAKEKWCPMVRVTSIANIGVLLPKGRKPTSDGSYEDYCVASDCMMWRWVEHSGEMLGYCGLGGKV